MDLHELFVPSQPVHETILRGACVYFGLVAIFRVIPTRQSSGIGVADVLVVVLISDAVQNGMAGDYTSITEALLLGATLVFCDYILDLLKYKSRTVERLLSPNPVPVVRHGKMLRRNMKSEILSEHDLKTKLREAGVENIADVKFANMENDGTLSVIKF